MPSSLMGVRVCPRRQKKGTHHQRRGPTLRQSCRLMIRRQPRKEKTDPRWAQRCVFLRRCRPTRKARRTRLWIHSHQHSRCGGVWSSVAKHHLFTVFDEAVKKLWETLDPAPTSNRARPVIARGGWPGPGADGFFDVRPLARLRCFRFHGFWMASACCPIRPLARGGWGF